VTDALSPSGINSLLACPRRLAYARDPSTRTWSRPTPRTALGVVAHALTEAAGTEDLPPQAADRAAWLEARWDLLISQQMERLSAAWPHRAVPQPRAWPGYAITKVRLIRHLTRNAPTRASAPGLSASRSASAPAGTSAPAAAPPLPWVERTLRSDHLFGTPDLVEEIEGKLRVVDLKAGVHQAETTPNQRRQLLLYAGLVQSALSRLPDMCVIVDARGTETSFTVTQPDVDAALADAESARAAFNESITAEEGPPARPTSENCRWCDYRVVCSAYWGSRQADWPSTTGDIVGVVTRVTHPYTELRAFDSDDAQRVVLSSADGHAREGDVVAVTDAARAGFQTSRPRWNSHVRFI
jgi:CRISPR/Cas system-associated exonuclease Cas4 (RecB family)